MEVVVPPGPDWSSSPPPLYTQGGVGGLEGGERRWHQCGFSSIVVESVVVDSTVQCLCPFSDYIGISLYLSICVP